MPADSLSPYLPYAEEAALRALAISAAANVPGVEFASITVLRQDKSLYTLAATEPLASEIDALQYELGEGPCVAAVTEEVSKIAGVTKVDVDLPTGSVTVTADAPVSDSDFAAAIDEAGFEVASA